MLRTVLWLLAAVFLWGCVLSVGWSSGVITSLTYASMQRDPLYQAVGLRLSAPDKPHVLVIGDSEFQAHWIDQDTRLRRVVIPKYDLNDLVASLSHLRGGLKRFNPPCRIIAQADPTFALRMRDFGSRQKNLSAYPNGRIRLWKDTSIRNGFRQLGAWAAADRQGDPKTWPAERELLLHGQARYPDPSNENWNALMKAAMQLPVPLDLIEDMAGREYPDALTDGYRGLKIPTNARVTRGILPDAPSAPGCGG